MTPVTYMDIQGLGKCKQDKVLHHDQLQPYKACQKQCETVLPATKQQLLHYSTQAPENLSADLPPEKDILSQGSVETTGSIPQKGFN
ncbi:hypothetical protein DSO57_1012533 [Entomophthora muscae]|uniref:Uncharacterized protein n=1 Tax=Entomophthora muscae TaxID=34485 RepID=A0ACC2SV33_9FUNG|nr:hypothetical protein DSO57_1012533 [Entomophthora muscae]